jgi:hypothetical protein
VGHNNVITAHAAVEAKVNAAISKAADEITDMIMDGCAVDREDVRADVLTIIKAYAYYGDRPEARTRELASTG